MKNSHLIEPEIIKEKLEHWRFGVANAYYEPENNEIHILNAEDLYIKTMWHEREHHDRSSKITFRLAQAMLTPALSVMLFGFLVVFGVYGALTAQFLPALIVAGVLVFFVACAQYEESKANAAVLRELSRYKDTGVIEY